MTKIIPFQLRLVEEVSREIKADAAHKGMTKHQWIEKAIAEKLERDNAM